MDVVLGPSSHEVGLKMRCSRGRHGGGVGEGLRASDHMV